MSKSPPSAAQNLAGITAALVSSLTLIVNDTLTKTAAETLPTSEIIVLRGLAATVMIVVIAPFLGDPGIRSIRWMLKPVVSLRVFSEVGATILYLTALFHLPIASATMIQQMLPLAVTAGAALFLGAMVGWRQWLAIGVGFFGVAIILRPGPEGLDVWMLVAVAAVGFMTLRDLATRVMPAAISTLSVTLLTMMATVVLGLFLSVREPWIMPSLTTVAILVAAAFFLILGFFFLIASLRDADVAIVAPFRYSTVLWAIVAGYLIWGDVPDMPTLAGAGIVIAAGLYTVHRQRIARRRARG